MKRDTFEAYSILSAKIIVTSKTKLPVAVSAAIISTECLTFSLLLSHYSCKACWLKCRYSKLILYPVEAALFIVGGSGSVNLVKKANLQFPKWPYKFDLTIYILK